MENFRKVKSRDSNLSRQTKRNLMRVPKTTSLICWITKDFNANAIQTAHTHTQFYWQWNFVIISLGSQSQGNMKSVIIFINDSYRHANTLFRLYAFKLRVILAIEMTLKLKKSFVISPSVKPSINEMKRIIEHFSIMISMNNYTNQITFSF